MRSFIVVFLWATVAVAQPVRFESKELGFTAIFPDEVVRTQVEMGDNLIRGFSSTLVEDSAFFLYAVMVIEAKRGEPFRYRRQDERTVLRVFVAGKMAAAGGRVISTKEIEVGQHPAIEFLTLTELEGVPMVARGFAVLSGGRIFSATVKVPQSVAGGLPAHFLEFARSIRLADGSRPAVDNRPPPIAP
jgi:hypothetical protein